MVQCDNGAVSDCDCSCTFTSLDCWKGVRVGHEVIINTRRIIYGIISKVFSSSKNGTQSKLANVVLMINVLSKT